MFQTEADVGICGEMKNHVDVFRGFSDCGDIEKVTLNEAETRRAQGAS